MTRNACHPIFLLAETLEFIPGTGRHIGFLNRTDLSAIVLKLVLEALAGEENAAFHRAEGKTHLLGNLAVLIAGDVHLERHLIFIGECIDGNADFLSGIRTFGACEA